VESVPLGERKQYLAEGPVEAEKVQHLKQQIRLRHPVREYARPDEVFGQMVLEDLWAAIEAQYPQDEPPDDELQIERSYHEAFIENGAEGLLAGLNWWNF